MNDFLDVELYKILRKGIPQEINKREAWYNISYKIFTSQRVESKSDFYKMIAFAYSWMPTIPKIDIGLVENNLRMDLILQLQNGTLEKKDREVLLKI